MRPRPTYLKYAARSIRSVSGRGAASGITGCMVAPRPHLRSSTRTGCRNGDGVVVAGRLDQLLHSGSNQERGKPTGRKIDPELTLILTDELRLFGAQSPASARGFAVVEEENEIGVPLRRSSRPRCTSLESGVTKAGSVVLGSASRL
jgi:hypothetical protein